jgi:hypothetical protein
VREAGVGGDCKYRLYRDNKDYGVETMVRRTREHAGTISYTSVRYLWVTLWQQKSGDIAIA